MSVILKGIKELYQAIDEGIREGENHFMIGLKFILFWIFIIAFVLFLIALAYFQWKIVVGILIVLLVIEFLIWFGKKLKKKNSHH